MSAFPEPRPIELHIEELVLDGVPSGDREAVAAAVQSRLATLLTDRGLPSTTARVDHVDAGQVELPPDTPPRSTGNRVAEALYRGLRR